MAGSSPAMTISGRSHPIAMKAVRNTSPQLHHRRGACLDIAGVEHRKIAAVFAGAPDHREQPAIAFGGAGPAFDEYRLGNGVAGWEQIPAAPRSLAIDMNHARQRAEGRQIRVGAGVPAMVVGE